MEFHHTCGVFILLIFSCVRAYNIDTSRPYAVYRGNPDSYFGLAVHFHKYQDKKWLLVGAPRDNSSFYAQSDLVRPGAVYQCDLSVSGLDDQTCTQSPFDQQGNRINESVPYFKHTDIKDNQFLGKTIVSHTINARRSTVVASAHLWSNRLHYDKNRIKDYYLLNGAYYIQNASLDSNVMEGHKVSPLLDYRDQFVTLDNETRVQFYALGMSGFSAHYMKDGTLLLGGPGVNNFGGGIYHERGGTLDTSSFMVYRTAENLPGDSYMGYSVSSGQFHASPYPMVVTGAPRYNDIGTVFLYSVHDKDIEFKIQKEGEQYGSYFGATILTADFNNDGYDDLLVGAPYYNNSVGDEGKVYVYLDNGQDDLVEKAPLCGSNSPGSRFGSAIALAGNINQDDHIDVLISAPYEDDGKGAVYVYHGTANGVNPQYSQRITAQTIGLAGCFGFGSSITGDLDVDGNNYPDIGVGCYGSASAVVLLSSAVMQIKPRIIVHGSNQIRLQTTSCVWKNTSIPCMAFGLNFQYTGFYAPETVDIEYTLKVDTYKTSQRFPARAGLGDDLKHSVTGLITLEKDATKEEFPPALLFSYIPNDVFTPIRVELSFRVVQENSAAYPAAILNKHLPNSTYKEFEFQKDCGEDEICSSDLVVDVQAQEDHIIIGESVPVALAISVENKGEPAYKSEVLIHHPPQLTYTRNIYNSSSSGHLSCIPQTRDIEDETIESGPKEKSPLALLICEIGHPLPTNAQKNFTVEFEGRHVVELFPQNTNVTFKVEVVTTSVDSGENSHGVSTLPLVISAHLWLSGVSVPDQSSITPEKEHIQDVLHVFDMINQGPGLLHSATVQVTTPVHLDGEDAVMARHVKLKGPDGIERTCESQKSTTSVYQRVPSVDDGDYQDFNVAALTERLIDKQPVEQKLDCDNLPCGVYTCHIGRLDKHESVTITASYHFGVTAPKNVSAYHLETTLYLLQGAAVPYPRSHQVTTPLYVLHAARSGLQWWVILVSATVGIVGLIIMALVLWKCGFFRRGQKEELERLLKSEHRQDGEDVDEEETYEEIPGERNNNGGIVQLDVRNGRAGYLPMESEVTVTPNVYSDGACAFPSNMEGYEVPLMNQGDYIHAPHDEYLKTGGTSRDPKAPLPSPPVKEDTEKPWKYK